MGQGGHAQREAPRSPSSANPGWMRAELCPRDLWEWSWPRGPWGSGGGHSLGWKHRGQDKVAPTFPTAFPWAWHPLSPLHPSSGPLSSLPLSSFSPLHPSWK